MSKRWKEEEEHLLRLLIPTNSYNEIAEEFSRRFNKKLPGFSQLRSSEAIRRKCSRDLINADSAIDYQDPYQERWDKIKKLVSEHKMETEKNSVGLIETPARKILTVSDLHFPFTLEVDLYNVLNEHYDADVVVLNGDILDGYIYSTFSKAKRIAALKEYIAAFQLVQYCSENFPKVVIVSGNHDVRPAKALQRLGFEKEESQILRPDLLARIANGEQLNSSGELIKKLDFNNVVYQKYDSWYVRIGKTIFCHPTGYKGGPGGTAQKLYDYFIKRINSDDFDSIVVGHTHKIYKGVFANKLLIEQGAMCDRLPYQHKADLRFIHAMNGYAIIIQDENGNTDFNLSGPVYLGSQLPPKKGVI